LEAVVDGMAVRNYRIYIEPSTGGLIVDKQTRGKVVKLVPIGNSKGIRIPKPLLQKYGMSVSLLLEETADGLLLRSASREQLSWEETYQAMAVVREDWGDIEETVADGLEDEDRDPI
jgi:antitoxin MazE